MTVTLSIHQHLITFYKPYYRANLRTRIEWERSNAKKVKHFFVLKVYNNICPGEICFHTKGTFCNEALTFLSNSGHFCSTEKARIGRAHKDSEFGNFYFKSFLRKNRDFGILRILVLEGFCNYWICFCLFNSSSDSRCPCYLFHLQPKMSGVSNFFWLVGHIGDKFQIWSTRATVSTLRTYLFWLLRNCAL